MRDIIVFIASLPDNVRSGLAVFCYLSAYLLLMFLAICSDIAKRRASQPDKADIATIAEKEQAV